MIEVYQQDCADVATVLAPRSVQLIVTSPPYADARGGVGAVPPEEYVEWFMRRQGGFWTVLRNDGTFILNIKERVVHGERSTYVLELILAMRKAGWRWTEEFIWHKRNCYPGKWPNRFRDAWERCLQFNKGPAFSMYQGAVRVPMGSWAQTRLKNLSGTDQRRDESRVGSGFGKNISNWVGRDLAYPTNVLHLATESSNRGHDATFPRALPEFFIRLFTRPGDLVLDPFLGSGTTLEVAAELDRAGVGFEVDAAHYVTARKRLARWLDAMRGVEYKDASRGVS